MQHDLPTLCVLKIDFPWSLEGYLPLIHLENGWFVSHLPSESHTSPCISCCPEDQWTHPHLLPLELLDFSLPLRDSLTPPQSCRGEVNTIILPFTLPLLIPNSPPCTATWILAKVEVPAKATEVDFLYCDVGFWRTLAFILRKMEAIGGFWADGGLGLT